MNMEQDIAAYTVKAIGDERLINKSLHIRPPLNQLSQHDLIYIYEDKVFRQLCIGNRLVRAPVSEAELDAQIAGGRLARFKEIALLVSCMYSDVAVPGCGSDCRWASPSPKQKRKRAAPVLT